MRSVDAYAELRDMGRPAVTTAEAATRLRTNNKNASQLLRRMESAGLVRRVMRGLWALDASTHPRAIVPFLTAPYPGYVSLWSALYEHAMIEQVPRAVSVASLRRSGRIVTGFGTFEVHRLAPEVFGGFEGNAETGFVAVPEKAIFDTVYLRAAAGSVAFFPELELPEDFAWEELGSWSDRIASTRLRTLVTRHLDRLQVKQATS